MVRSGIALALTVILVAACGETTAGAPSGSVLGAEATRSTRIPTATLSALPTAVATPAAIPSASATPPPSPTPSPSPSASPKPTRVYKPAPKPGPFSMDLYRKGDFVHQATKDYCVPAAMLTMMNIMRPGADHSRATQARLYSLARRLSPPTLKGPGAEPEGEVRALKRLGFGDFDVAAAPSLMAAIRKGARAMRATNKPVGLLVWRGAHSWVMSGFKSTADPAYTPDFEITHVYIQDVWYPSVSSIWGASRPPDSLVPVSALPEDYLKWRRPTGAYPGKDRRYVLIVPAM